MTAIQQPAQRISRDELITTADLIDFKNELLSEISLLLRESQSEKPVTKQWLKTKEVRALLKISGGKLMTMRVNGTLPYTRIGGVIYYEYLDIEKMLTEQKIDRKNMIPSLRG